MVLKPILLQLTSPGRGLCPIWSHGQQRYDGLYIVQLLCQTPDVSSQLCRCLAVFGNIIYTGEILRLAGVALWPNTVALHQSLIETKSPLESPTNLGFALPAALACNGGDLATRSSQGVRAGYG